MVGDDKNKTDNNNSGGGRRFGWFSAMTSNNNEEQSTSKFRVEADIVENRLLVFADTAELEKVYKCLAEMGEVPARGHGVDTMRVLDLGAGDEQKVLLERLRQVWPSLGKDGNKLIIDVPEKKAAPAQEESKPGQTAPKAPAAAAPNSVPSASDKNEKPPTCAGCQSGTLRQLDADGSHPVRRPEAGCGPGRQHVGRCHKRRREIDLRSLRACVCRRACSSAQSTAHAQGDEKPASGSRRLNLADDLPSASKGEQPDAKTNQGAPIYITRGEDGKLVITSRDTPALDQLEEMAGRLAPRRKDYAVYYLKHADAYGVKANLDDFFQTEKKESGEDRARRWWWDDDTSNKKDDSPMLSRRKPMRFIVDGQTNSILVQGGTADQLRQIKELIDMYDSPAPVSVRPARLTQLFHIQHSKASVIADVIKDIYRDLLSTKDKAIESFNQTKAQGRGGGRGYGHLRLRRKGRRRQDEPVAVQRGRLAGCRRHDEHASRLVRESNLDDQHPEIIERLDKAAVQAAQSFQVLQINRSIDANALQKKLAEMLKKTAPVPEAGQQPNQGQQNQGQRRGRGGRNGGGNGGGNNEGNETSND